ncbi:hypothetical protein SISSUDRAFT_1127685 [Sistotremastrum suecicum HHB10207 ss-3]|uniref:Uncharacterized protein n=1 Tax=Sistotremastrum suecicum HHB10207 ss-3 TaxID=1314776 RepID=A0A166EUU6_9AGAM|nr:hypothetical protein SISSUDRAFT_1127685 [Sistotremastrum suecicum HHB10207 ss-3]
MTDTRPRQMTDWDVITETVPQTAIIEKFQSIYDVTPWPRAREQVGRLPYLTDRQPLRRQQNLSLVTYRPHKAPPKDPETQSAPTGRLNICDIISRECDGIETLQFFGDIREALAALCETDYETALVDNMVKVQLGVEIHEDPVVQQMLEKVADLGGFVVEDE